MLFMCVPRGGGGQGVRSPLENHKNIEFLRNTSPGPLNFSKLSSQHSMLGHNRHLNGVSLAGRCWPAFKVFGSSLP